VAVLRDDVWVEPAGARGKALLASLALAAPRAVPVDALGDDIWGDDPPSDVKGAVQALVSRLRTAFGDGLVESTPSGYRAGVEPAAIDLHHARSLSDRAREQLLGGDAQAAAGSAADALALWRGAAGSDLPASALRDDLGARAGRIEDSLELTAATALLELGSAAEAEDRARRLSSRSPFDDSAQLLLLRALEAQGRPSEAVAAYAAFRERVHDELGALPSAELQAFNLDLLDRLPASRRTDGRAPGRVVSAENPAAAAGAGSRGLDEVSPSEGRREPGSQESRPPVRRGVGRGIRAAPNALIGRDAAVADVLHSLGQARVTTILGAGGLGKTRLAHEVAALALDTFPSVVVVELASVRSDDDVVFAIATALGIREIGTSRRVGDQVVRADLGSRILNRLAEQPTLLVVDNCEHLVDAAAEWVSMLTAELPRLTVLTTSRTPLAISSERVYVLPPLGAGGRGSGSRGAMTGPAISAGTSAAGTSSATISTATTGTDPAVRLFIDRATAARPDAALPLDAVERLVQRLDGLPLAIELAAARIRSMSIDEIERRLGNRFALLTGGDRSAPERHRTLLAVIEWSWNLLTADEQRALAHLADFADGFSAEAAAAVVGDGVDDALESLVAQSLVTVTETGAAAGGGLRFRMLETVREFGRLQLEREGSVAVVRDAVFAWAEAVSERLLPRLNGTGQETAFAQIALDEDNLIDVLRRSIDAERPDVVAAVFALLANYWLLRSAPTEVSAFRRPVFDSIRRYWPEPGKADVLQLALVMLAASLLLEQDRSAAVALSRLRRLRAAYPTAEGRLDAMGELALSVGSLERVQRVVERALTSTDRQTALLGSVLGALLAENDGRLADSVALCRRAISLADALGDTWGAATASQLLAQLQSQAGRAEEALTWARRAREGMIRINASEDLRQLDWMIAVNDIAIGEIDEASDLFEQLIESPGQTDGVDIVSIGLAGRAQILRTRGRLVESAEANREALASFVVPRSKASPWYRMILATVIVAFGDDGTALPGETRAMARRLRSRSLAGLRDLGGFIDRPVLGASVVGLGVWAMGEPALGPRLALDMLALAEVMGTRQDTPPLRLAPLFTRVAATLGDDVVAGARASAALIPADERPGRASNLLRTPGPWSWGWAG
jgi:predicted ATPase/DNA-binding SARP family transcriptional activator